MLKRIGVVSSAASVADAVRNGAGAEDIEVLALERPPLPPGVSAIIADAACVDLALPLLLEQAESMTSLLELLGVAIDAREQFILGSSKRVRDHATRLAVALGLGASERSCLERAALVRDIGKLRISNEVLLKKSVLTYDEWSLLQAHTVLGAELVGGIPALADTADIVRRHHCCYDGTGYPDGLEADAIPFLARAMKVLDVYCAMTSPRHYRKGVTTHDDAVAYLLSERGKHFDPAVVDAFIEANVGETSPAERD